VTGRPDPGDPGGASDAYRNCFTDPAHRRRISGVGVWSDAGPGWPGFVPDTFVLHRPSGEDTGMAVIAGWGMTLPDGTAVIAMPGGQGTYLGVAASADNAASTHHAELTWLSRADPAPPP
jgi:hypothetical protein